MNNLKHIHVNIYFEHKVDSLRNELINLGTFNYNIKALPKNKNKEIDKKYGIIKQKRRNLWQ